MHDLVVRGGTISDGSGGTPFTGDVPVDPGLTWPVLSDAAGGVEGRQAFSRLPILAAEMIAGYALSALPEVKPSPVSSTGRRCF